MPRGARLDAPGTLHHAMVRGIEGMAIVQDDEDRKRFVDRLGVVATVTGTSIYACVVLRDALYYFNYVWYKGTLFII
jgi:hypothetical protein